MASRKDAKKRLRAERIAKETEAARLEARRRRLRQVSLAGGAVLAVGAVVLAVAAGGGGGGGSARPKQASAGGPPIPGQRIRTLQAAATAAGCVVRDYPNYGQDHTGDKVTYKTNPPTSGPHNPVPAHDGDYVGQGTPEEEMLVHAMEHGRVEIQYRPGTLLTRQRQLETLLNEPILGQPSGFDQLLFENQTGMPYAVAATAWQHLLGCKTFNDRAFDALRAFRAQYANHGPESIPFPE